MSHDPHNDSLPKHLAEAIGRRLLDRGTSYDPWVDLRRRTGVEMRWHYRNVSRWEKPLGVTFFDQLAVSLRVDTNEMAMRGTLTHELIHLERGPRGNRRSEKAEERIVELTTAKRLVDPVLFDILTACGKPAPGWVWRVLRVDDRHFSVYARWRAGVSDRTAVREWDRYSNGAYPVWPAPWMGKHADKWSDLPALSAALESVSA